MQNRDILLKAIEIEELFIPVSSEAEQESFRVSLFNTKRKLPGVLKDSVGIQKVTIDGNLFIKVFYKPPIQVLVMKEGTLVSLEEEKEDGDGR